MIKSISLTLISIFSFNNIIAQDLYSFISITDNKAVYMRQVANPDPGWCFKHIESGYFDLLTGEKVVSPFQFERLDWHKKQNRFLAYEEYMQNTAGVKDVFLMDTKLNPIVNRKFSFLLTSFSRYWIGTQNGQTMIYDQNFTPIPMTEGTVHTSGKASNFVIMKKNSFWILLDSNLNEMPGCKFDTWSNASNPPVFKKNDNYYVIDPSTNTIGNPIRSTKFPRFDGELIVLEDSVTNLAGAIDINNNIIFPFKYRDIYHLGTFYMLYNSVSDQKYIDKFGKEFPKGFVRVGANISDSLFLQDNRSLNKPDSVIDKRGISVLKNVKYDKIYLSSSIDEPLLIVRNGVPEFYNLNGDKLLIPGLTNAAPFKDGYAYAWISDKMGIINKLGYFVLAPRVNYSWQSPVIDKNYQPCDYVRQFLSQTVPSVTQQISEPTKVFAVDVITGQKSNVVLYYIKGGVVYARDGITGLISNTKLKFIVGNTVYAVDGISGQRSNTVLYYIENGVVYASDALTGQKTNIPLRYIENKIVYASDAITYKKTNIILRYIDGDEITD